MAEVYNTDRFAILYAESRDPPKANLGLAARYLCDLFATSGIEAAFMGGWAMNLRGNARGTNDVDLTVRCTMPPLMRILRAQARLFVPEIYGSTAVQVFVRTGGRWEPAYDEVNISVDIIINGNLGTPQRFPRGTQVINPTRTTQGTGPVTVLNIRYQMSTKLQAFFDRRSENDYLDIEFLVMQHGRAIWEVYDYFEAAHCEAFVASFAARHPGDADSLGVIRQTLGLP
ncbi:MAG: hypothetical protein M1818_007590 [Claussenomyces sp. TS43310]|nr:MAG: hypothetical protein M1818_007590 [Claussenomyces sp. TS43310]